MGQARFELAPPEMGETVKVGTVGLLLRFGNDYFSDQSLRSSYKIQVSTASCKSITSYSHRRTASDQHVDFQRYHDVRFVLRPHNCVYLHRITLKYRNLYAIIYRYLYAIIRMIAIR